MCNRLLAISLLAGGWITGLQAADGDKLFFSRDFPGSVPEYFNVTVHPDGKVEYRESQDEDPLEFQGPEQDISRLFEISEKLEYFEEAFPRPKRETAFTGDKILRYIKADGDTNEAAFVATNDELVQELISWFLRVADTEWHRINIERAIQFDRLGVNKAILQFHAAFDRGRIVAPEQFLPLLQDISNDMKIVHLARSRAAGLVEQIEAAKVGGE